MCDGFRGCYSCPFSLKGFSLVLRLGMEYHFLVLLLNCLFGPAGRVEKLWDFDLFPLVLWSALASAVQLRTWTYAHAPLPIKTA